MQQPMVIRRMKREAESRAELEPGVIREGPQASHLCNATPGIRISHSMTGGFRYKFLQYWRFSACDLLKEGHQLMPMHHRARQHRCGSTAGSAASPCQLPAHRVLEIWLQPILLPARSHSPPQTAGWGAGEKAAAVTASRGCPAHPGAVCPSLPSSCIRLSGSSLTAWWEPQTGAKYGGKKRQKNQCLPHGTGDLMPPGQKERCRKAQQSELKPVPSSVPQFPHL